jgi:transglutaminase-like putative cysteine protease
MKKNIRYVAVYLSLGRVVPNEAASVLHNKFGDCKDKATLMSALLAAKGIASEQALINLGNAYMLPEPPTMVSATPGYSGSPCGQADRRCRTSAATMPRGFSCRRSIVRAAAASISATRPKPQTPSSSRAASR